MLVGLAVMLVGAAIVAGIAASARAADADAVTNILSEKGARLRERMALLFEPAVAMLHVAAAAVSEMDLGVTSWAVVGTPLLKVGTRARTRARAAGCRASPRTRNSHREFVRLFCFDLSHP